ncbi:MAG: penicillin-binding protein 2 [Bacteroidales bacterium]|nr:penicillin-binding protein 2 [Bacteroidales bacterium]
MSNKSNNLTNRKLLVMGVFVTVGVVYLVRLFSLQVLDKKYKQLADNNALRFVTQYPARGKIFDRNGNLMVFNEAVYDLMVIPKQACKIDSARPFDTMEFCRLLRISKESYVERMAKAKKESYMKPSPFLTQVSKEDYAHIAEVLYRYPGFRFQTRTVRHYPSAIAAHTLGDIGEISQIELERDKEGECYYRQGDYIGKSGIEKSYERELRGVKGLKVVVVDVHNREMGRFMDGELDEDPVAGKDIYLGMDADLQAYGEQLMVGKIGSVVAVEPATGQILAFVSSPTYDPNLLVGRERGTHYKELQNDPMKPLINRAVSGTYPPGSTFKTVVGLIAMQSGSITPGTCFHCSGLASLPIKCTHSHGSSPDFANAIMNSCNPYFYESFKATINNRKFGGVKQGYQYWKDMTYKMGLGHKFNTDIPYERSGNIPTPEYYDKMYGGQWNAVTIRSLGIGQGEVLLTPLQLANIAAMIANEGFYYPPHLIKCFGDSTAIPEVMTTKVFSGIEPQYFRVMKRGLRTVFSGPAGTARRFEMKDIPQCGKTGTAQNPHGNYHSNFVAFAPEDDPKIAIAVIIENGGYGATWAAPIASLMIEKYIRGYTVREELEKRMMEGRISYKSER